MSQQNTKKQDSIEWQIQFYGELNRAVRNKNSTSIQMLGRVGDVLLCKCMCCLCACDHAVLRIYQPELTNFLLQKCSVLSWLPLLQILPAARADVQ
jgi:hypothetical protein